MGLKFSIRIQTILFFALSLTYTIASGQGMYTTFGQNRVQYGRFEWSFLRSENYDAYFYSGGREIATFAARTAEQELNDVENMIDHRLSGRVEIICYNNLTDYKQGNFNLSDEAVNTGGVAQVNSNKIFVYFNGNHADFKRQIRSGVALVLINELLFGGNIQERIQNAALLNLPDWYLIGLTGYIGNAWDVEKDNLMKDLILSGKLKKFNRLIQQNQELAGISFWRFLIDKYGIEVISNMLYVTRLSRNFETALIYVTGANLKQTGKDWLQYYKDQYAKEDNNRTIPINTLKIKKRLQPYAEPNISVSPKGNKVVYSTNKNGKYKIWLLDTKTGKSKKVAKGGLKYHHSPIDHSYPQSAWHPGGEKFSYIHEKKGKVMLTTIDLVTKKKQSIQFLKFDKIMSFAYADNEKTLVLSAVRKGQSDIYVYDITSRRERQLTNDVHDDLYPRFVDGSSKIIFSSNRNSHLLNAPATPTLAPENNLDIYLYDYENPGTNLKRLSYTPFIDETHPIEYNNQYYAYLTDYNGIKNRYAVRIETEYDFTELNIHYKNPETPADTLYFDQLTDLGTQFEYEGKTFKLDSNISTIDTIIHNKDIVFTYPLTNYKRNILSHDVARQTQTQYEVLLDEKKVSIKYNNLADVVNESKKTETYPNMYRLKSGHTNKPFVAGPVVYSDRKIKQAAPAESKIEKPAEVEKYEYFFVNDYTSPDTKAEDIKVQTPVTTAPGIMSAKNFKLAAPRFYDVTFFSDFLVTQLDNSVINTYYQPITPDGQNMFNPGLNGMFKVGLIDLFEDYRIVGGFRYTLDLSGADYFLSYENLKRRLDHKFTFYRQVREGQAENTAVKSTSNELRYQIKYPFNPVISIRLSTFGRMDRDVFLATSRASLERPDNLNYWVGGKLELVFDNTIPKGLNLWNGTRFKLFYERYQNWEKQEVQLNAMGFDFRHYQPLHRQLIFAFRLTYNTSFGPAKVKYVLGGLDNWLFAQYDNSQGTIATQNYAFQALATNLRGFKQNIRNGNSFASMSNEIRFPVFAYLFNKPIRSEFINNFQIVPFFDVGTAWVGNNPYSEDNTNNLKIVEVKYLKVTVINVREPIVAGLGSGLRTKLFGYFVRFDTAWGIQDREFNKKPMYYFSLSTDF